MAHDISDQLREAWICELDHERAVALARPPMERIRDGDVDPVPLIEVMEGAVEPLWDSQFPDPGLVLAAVSNAQIAFRHAERFGELEDPQRIEVRCRPQILLARAYHCGGDSRRALLVSYEVLRWLGDLVGGMEILPRLLARGTESVIAKYVVAALGIYAAALRRASLTPQARETYIEPGREMVRAYVLGSPRIVRYARTAALAAQWAYLLMENVRQGVEEDPALIIALYELDELERTNVRAGVTRALRDFEFARFRKDKEAALRFATEARRSLRQAGFLRHLQVIDERNLLAV